MQSKHFLLFLLVLAKQCATRVCMTEVQPQGNIEGRSLSESVKVRMGKPIVVRNCKEEAHCAATAGRDCTFVGENVWECMRKACPVHSKRHEELRRLYAVAKAAREMRCGKIKV